MKVLLTILFFILAWFGSIHQIEAQITVDSLKKKLAGISKVANSAKFSEAVMQMQAIFFSDTLMLLNQRVEENLKKTVGEKDIRYAGAITGMAILYMWKGEYEKSLPLLQQSAEIFKNAGKEDNVQYPIILNNLGLLYERIGQYDKALLFYQQGLDIRKKILKEDNFQYALFYPISLSNLGSLLMKIGKYDKAQPLFEQAIDIRKKILGEEHPYYAISLNNLAFLYAGMGDYEKALPLFQRTLEVYKKAFGEDDLEYMAALDNLALLYVNTGDCERAKPLFDQVVTWRKNKLGEDHPSYAASLNNTALLCNVSANKNEASSLLIKAANISLKHLSRTYFSLSELEKIIFLKQQSSEFNYLPSLLFTQRIQQPEIINQVYANELVLKGMVLEDQQQVLRSIRQSGDSTALRLYRRWRFNKALAGKQLLLPKTQGVPDRDSIAEITNHFEQELSRSSGAFRELQRIQTIRAKSISDQLQKGQAVIEFFHYKLYNKKWTDSIIYAAMVLLPKDSVARFIPLFEEKQLKRLLRPSLNSDAPINVLYPSPFFTGNPGIGSSSLYRLIWKPLVKHLKDVQTIYYAPSGLLQRIAFQALQADPGHLLIDDYQLHQLLSSRSLAMPRQTISKLISVEVWGNIEYDIRNEDYIPLAKTNKSDTTASFFNLFTEDTRSLRGKGWKSLPGTKIEMDSITSVFAQAGLQISTKSGDAATEENFKALDGKSPQVLHIATHGFFLPIEETTRKIFNNPENNNNGFTVQQDPMFRSGLVLAGGNHAWKGKAAIPGSEDGILTAYEIAQMDLSNTQLVVLSACETALGDLQGNEGVIGLQRAFKIAGAKQMMMSLWRVPDKETMQLMTLFYKYWLSGQTAREALRSAQLKMRKKYSPYYWAGFVLVE